MDQRPVRPNVFQNRNKIGLSNFEFVSSEFQCVNALTRNSISRNVNKDFSSMRLCLIVFFVVGGGFHQLTLSSYEKRIFFMDKGCCSVLLEYFLRGW